MATQDIKASIEMPEGFHPNRTPWSGTLTFCDRASDSFPSGSRGHKVMLVRSACEEALCSLLGMGLSLASDASSHGGRKIGIVTRAEIKAIGMLTVSGFVYGCDYPSVVALLRAKGPWGMSYEISNAEIDDMQALVWVARKFVFSGCAVLSEGKAAYRGTSFRLE